MNTPSITLGGREYTLLPPPIGRARRWREQLRETTTPMLRQIDQLKGLGALASLESIPIDGVIGMITSMVPTLMGAFDEIAELVYAYSPLLAADREFIEETATDAEMLAAFGVILKQAFPLGELMTFLGQPNLGILRNSASPSTPTSRRATTMATKS